MMAALVECAAIGRAEGDQRRVELAKRPQILQRADGDDEMTQCDGVEAVGAQIVQERSAAAHEHHDGVSLVPHRHREVPYMDLGAADRVSPGHDVGDLQLAPLPVSDIPASPARSRSGVILLPRVSRP